MRWDQGGGARWAAPRTRSVGRGHIMAAASSSRASHQASSRCAAARAAHTPSVLLLPMARGTSTPARTPARRDQSVRPAHPSPVGRDKSSDMALDSAAANQSLLSDPQQPPRPATTHVGRPPAKCPPLPPRLGTHSADNPPPTIIPYLARPPRRAAQLRRGSPSYSPQRGSPSYSSKRGSPLISKKGEPLTNKLIHR